MAYEFGAQSLGDYLGKIERGFMSRGENDSEFRDKELGLNAFMVGPGNGTAKWRVYNSNPYYETFNGRTADKSVLNGLPWVDYDAEGNLVQQGNWEGLKKRNTFMSDVLPFAMVAAPFAATAAGVAGAAGAAAGGAGASAGGAGLGSGSGAFLGEGLHGAGVWGADGALIGGGGAAGAGGAAAAGGGSTVPNLGSLIKSGATSLFGGGGGGAAGGFNWGSLIGPATQIGGAIIGSNAAKDAANTQAGAAREAAAMFEPWRRAGEFGVNKLATIMGREGPEAAKSAFTTSPDYQFRLGEQQKALERSAAARGGLYSGKALKDTIRFSGDMASTEFGNTYNRLSNLAGLGQTATGNTANYTTQGANAQAAGQVGTANAWNNALTQGYSMYQNGQQQNQYNALFNRLLGA